MATFEDFCNVTEADIGDMAKAFSKRTNAEGKITFGHGCTKKLKGLMHWIHDRYRCNDPVNHIDFTLASMNELLEQAAARWAEKEQIKTVSKTAKPDKFSKEFQWPSFYLAFKNYLSTILGMFDVPLHYVIREVDPPIPGEQYPTFNDRAVARAPLTGAHFIVDSRRVHQLLKSLIQGQPAENWIRDIAHCQCGRRDMIKLRQHYAGEGNASRRIAKVEKIKTSVQYKHERTMSFMTFWIHSSACVQFTKKKESPWQIKLRFVSC